jgi:hypothetical protein
MFRVVCFAIVASKYDSLIVLGGILFGSCGSAATECLQQNHRWGRNEADEERRPWRWAAVIAEIPVHTVT